jgi:hypothetical protein
MGLKDGVAPGRGARASLHRSHSNQERAGGCRPSLDLSAMRNARNLRMRPDKCSTACAHHIHAPYRHVLTGHEGLSQVDLWG